MPPDIADSLTSFEGHGVRFLYPDIWELDEQPQDDGSLMITVAADESCFWALRLMPDCPSPTDVVESCVSGYQEEYGEIEIHKLETKLAEMPAAGRSVDFTCFELINTATVLSVRCSEFTLLAWWQATDHELRILRPVLDQMTNSIRVLNLL